MHQKNVLLLNISNMKEFPVYPYAFIQIPAVARQHGIHVVCKDLLGIKKEAWGKTVKTLIEQHQPEMILITLRNTDSLVLKDYKIGNKIDAIDKGYFPIEQTKDLVTAIRSVTDKKITIGGFAFTLLHKELMHYLEPDFGVVAGPDEFFLRFEDILNGRLEEVSNLLYFLDGELKVNEVKFFPPLDEPEYTSSKIQQMLAFYQKFPSPGLHGGPVEVNRGCSHKCVFCAEPFGKGHKVRYRKISAIMTDIRMLVEHDIRNIYMISSELNPEGNDFVLNLADEIYAFNQSQPEGGKITWFGANYLLKFSYEEHLRLNRSGFIGGWFDITALDDKNARAMKTPYRNAQLLGTLKDYIRAERIRQVERDKSTNTKADVNFRWTMFMGNPATTIETIRNTLEIANQEGFAQEFSSCSLSTVMRVFDYEKLDDSALEVTFSITPDFEETTYNQILPSFAYAPALLQAFGSGAEIEQIFEYLSKTFLSTGYQATRNWLGFLHKHTGAAVITNWMNEISDTQEIDLPADLTGDPSGKPSAWLTALFTAEPQNKDEKETREHSAEEVVEALITTAMHTFPAKLQALGLPYSQSEASQTMPYALAKALLQRWQTENAFNMQVDKLCSSKMSASLQEFFRFCVRAILHKYNLKFSENLHKIFK